jgi:oligopeptide transport system substrate-binding protein
MSNEFPKKNKTNSRVAILFFVAALSVLLSACAEIQRPTPEPFYAETTPPAKQEFRWSNGRAPKSFDPARASAAPETDIVRALFEGLTDIDPRTLKEVPAAAEKWTSSPDLRVWTFSLRKDARWSNGERVTADDFLTSWKRLAVLGDKSAHRELVQNIVGLKTEQSSATSPIDAAGSSHSSAQGVKPNHNEQSNTAVISASPDPMSQTPAMNSVLDRTAKTETVEKSKVAPEKFGVEAVDESTLRITLTSPDRDLPKLVANPIFRPIYGDGVELDAYPLDADIITNGPFTVASVERDAIVLDRSDTYWDKASVSLERVRFVFKENAEAALTAYKKGEIDALTNAEFEPLAVKILSPYDDFRQTPHSALNLYEFNTKNAPFNDQRVREAFAISIDRERITDVELERMARPATSFLPLNDNTNTELSFDVQKAKQLLESAGFAAGAAFPKVRLLINRNDTQQRVARAISRMWKQNLNIDTEIIVKELSEIDMARASGDYDMVRRGIVLPTADEAAGMAAIFGPAKKLEAAATIQLSKGDKREQESNFAGPAKDGIGEPVQLISTGIVSEDEAIIELNAIPLYFPMAYSLVKPYVKGFEINGLDATTLKEINIDSTWQPKTLRGGS